MKQDNQLQAPDPATVALRIRIRGIEQDALAKRLRRSQTAISRALAGERKTLLGRINRYLDYLDRRDAAKGKVTIQIPKDAA
jgi:hypothetical protein